MSVKIDLFIFKLDSHCRPISPTVSSPDDMSSIFPLMFCEFMPAVSPKCGTNDVFHNPQDIGVRMREEVKTHRPLN